MLNPEICSLTSLEHSCSYGLVHSLLNWTNVAVPLRIKRRVQPLIFNLRKLSPKSVKLFLFSRFDCKDVTAPSRKSLQDFPTITPTVESSCLAVQTVDLVPASSRLSAPRPIRHMKKHSGMATRNRVGVKNVCLVIFSRVVLRKIERLTLK